MAFSQIKTSSVVRVKKSKIQKPSNSEIDRIATESATTTAESDSVEASRRTNSEVGESEEQGGARASLSLLGDYDSKSDSDGSD